MLGGGSALSSIYKKDGEQVVFKFLISPRNDIELERFKLEYSVLNYNNAHRIFLGPETSYPLPRICHQFEQKNAGLINYFSYKYEDGVLLSNLDTSKYSYKDKIFLLYRISSALSYFNQIGYSHRDLHPENILLLNNFSMCDRNNVYHGENDPRIKFLDMGNCQRDTSYIDAPFIIQRDLNENLVNEDNNRRILSSFISMPPDFIVKGKDTSNYDTWSFGVYAYKLMFGYLPFDVHDISDLSRILNNTFDKREYRRNLYSLHVGFRIVLDHLLSPHGEDRPTISTIVRLFFWLVYRDDEFNDIAFIQNVIQNQGFDPNHNPLDDIY